VGRKYRRSPPALNGLGIGPVQDGQSTVGIRGKTRTGCHVLTRTTSLAGIFA